MRNFKLTYGFLIVCPTIKSLCYKPSRGLALVLSLIVSFAVFTSVSAQIDYEQSTLDIPSVELSQQNQITVSDTEMPQELSAMNCTDDCSIIGTDEVKLDKTNTFGDNFFGVCEDPSNDVIPPFYYNTVSDKDSPDLKVDAKDGCVEVEGEIFDKVEIKKNSCVIFKGDNIFINELKVKDNATVIFEGCANVFINKKLKFEDNSTFNPSMLEVTLYVDDDVEVKKGSNISAHIYANDNKIKAEGKRNDVTQMTGLFVAKKVEGKKYVYWQGNAYCDPCPIEIPEPEPSCDCKGGMISITFTYDGNLSDLNSNEGTIVDNGDGSFTISNGGEKLDKDTFISSATGTAELHTSCSRNLLGIAFSGGITVVGYTDTNGNVSSTDTCPVAPVECDCDGKIIEMSVVYEGPNNATITVGDDENGNNAYTLTGVSNGDILDITLGNIGNWWYFSVNGSLEASIHTSCSDDILGNANATKSTFGNLGSFPDPQDGDSNGTFLVISHTDSNGGVCAIDYVDPGPPAFRSTNISDVNFAITNDIEMDSEVKVWPNPSNTYFNVEVATDDLVKIRVVDIRGRIIINEELKNVQNYKLGENFNPGLYIITIDYKNSSKTIKLIKR